MSKTVGNYTLVEKLGQGSYATVYKGHHKTNGGDFAVKVISREKIGSAKLQTNLEQEISIMKEINHENVVRLFGTFTSKNNIYLVLEFCGGGDLQLYIRKHKRLEEPVARRFLVQLARGLQFLHSKNIIHRDIKPQNLLLSEFSPNAIIKFADFGFAKHLHEASMAQTPCGTPLYMAPEIFEMKEYDAKADVWSIGCVLFEMCTGEPPFKGSNHRELFMNIRSKSLRLPSNVTLSPEITEILQRLLELNPQRRVSLDMLHRVTERMSVDMQQDPPSTSASSTAVSFSSSSTGRSGVQQQQQQQQDTNRSSSKDPDISESVSGSAFGSSRPASTTPATRTSVNANAVGQNEDRSQSGSESSSGGGRANMSGSSSSGGSSSGTPRRKSNDFTPPAQGTSPLEGGAGQMLRRVRSREKVQGRHSPTSALGSLLSEAHTAGAISNGLGSTPSSSMTPATATMLVKLAHSGTSPNAERSISEHVTSGGGGGGPQRCLKRSPLAWTPWRTRTAAASSSSSSTAAAARSKTEAATPAPPPEAAQVAGRFLPPPPPVASEGTLMTSL